MLKFSIDAQNVATQSKKSCGVCAGVMEAVRWMGNVMMVCGEGREAGEDEKIRSLEELKSVFGVLREIAE
jgi:hypothetical protein